MSAARPLAVVCLSGGLDSTVCCAMAAQEHEIAALHLQYGQRTQDRERQAFDAVCDHYGVRHRLVAQQPALGAMGTSALTDRSIPVPEQAPGEGIPVTYVPFRNGQILALATAWAEALGAVAVYLGAVQEDSSGYPDCRQEFLDAFGQAMQLGTRPGHGPQLRTPLLQLDKGQIVARGVELGAPLQHSWSCYQGEAQACGRCESCVLRQKGFAAAGATDPIAYAGGPR